MKQIIMAIFVLQFSLFAKDIYIKTATVGQNFSSAQVSKLENAGYNVYTQNYKNLVRIYVGPFQNMSDAKASLSQVKRDFARDAFITRVSTTGSTTQASRATHVRPVSNSSQQNYVTKKRIYIKTSTVGQSHLSEQTSMLQNAGYNVYTQNYKNLVRIYAGPFDDMNSASRSLSDIKSRIARDAFITQLTTSAPVAVAQVAQAPVTPMPSAVKKDVEAEQRALQEEAKRQRDIAEAKRKRAILEAKRQRDIAEAKRQRALEEAKKQQLAKAQPKAQPKEPKVTQEADEPTTAAPRDGRYFIGVDGGMGSATIGLTGDLALDTAFKNDVFSYGAQLGYYFTNNFFASINYQYSGLEDVSFHNLYTSLNYQFDEFYYISPYIGGIIGFNSLNWINTPLSTISSIDSTFSYIAGAQIGSDIIIGNNWALYLVYKYWIMDHSTLVSDGTNSTEIKFTDEQNLNFGIKYKF